jgi:hypothetical protein
MEVKPDALVEAADGLEPAAIGDLAKRGSIAFVLATSRSVGCEPSCGHPGGG